MISRQGLRLRAFLESEEEENYWVRTKKIKWWFRSAWFGQEVITTSEAPSCHCFPFWRRLVTPSSGSLCRMYTCPPKDAEPTKHVLKQKNRGLLFPMPTALPLYCAHSGSRNCNVALHDLQTFKCPGSMDMYCIVCILKTRKWPLFTVISIR